MRARHPNLDWPAQEKKAHYIAIVKRHPPLLHAQIRALPWRQVPASGRARETGHGRAGTRTLKAAHVSYLEFPGARQAIKITRFTMSRPRKITVKGGESGLSPRPGVVRAGIHHIQARCAGSNGRLSCPMERSAAARMRWRAAASPG